MRNVSVLLLALILVACNDSSSPPRPPVVTKVSMQPADWVITYSPGMPPHPSEGGTLGDGWLFQFPPPCGQNPDCSVHYVTTGAFGIHPSAGVDIDYRVDITGDITWNYKLNPNNTCDAPPHVAVMLQRINDDMQGQYGRYFATGAYMPVDAGEVKRDIAFDPDLWVDVQGQKASANPAQFQTLLVSLGNVGVVFGGGCFAGHGLQVVGSGQAHFHMLEFNVR